MHVANTTKQHMRLNLRLPETRKILVCELPSGCQVKIGSEWTEAQREYVLDQLRRYGAKPKDAINGRMADYFGLLFSLEDPVAQDVIEAAHVAVVERQEQVASDELTKAALGTDAATRDPRTKQRRAKSTTLSVKQDIPKNERPTGKEVNFGLTVTPDGRDDPGLRA